MFRALSSIWSHPLPVRVPPAALAPPSCTGPPATRVLLGAPSEDLARRFSLVDWPFVIRMRHLLSPASPDVGDVDSIISCRYGLRLAPRLHPFHALDCAANQWYKIQRRNLVRDLVIQFLRRHYTPHRIGPGPAAGSLNGLPITAEDNLGEFDILHTAHTSSSPTPHRCSFKLSARQNSRLAVRRTADRTREHFRVDLGVYPSTGGRVIIDVAVGNPAAVSYRNRPADRSPHNPPYYSVGYATEHREDAKIFDADDPDSLSLSQWMPPVATEPVRRPSYAASLPTHPALELVRNLKHNWMPLWRVITP